MSRLDARGIDRLLAKLDREPPVRYVVVGAEYGIYHELGTRKMMARPFLAPAVEQARHVGTMEAMVRRYGIEHLERAVDATATAVAAQALVNIRDWPLVDTGFLMNSLKVEKEVPR